MVELVDETISAADRITEDVEDALTVVAKSLRDASGSAQELSEDARAAFSNAAVEVGRVAETLRKNSVDAARGVTRQAMHEVHEHPLASVAAALTAVAAIVGVIMTARGRKALPHKASTCNPAE